MNIKVLDMFKEYDRYGFDRLDELIEFDDYLQSGAIREILIVHAIVNVGAITTSLGYIHYQGDVHARLQELYYNDRIDDDLLYTIDDIIESEMLEDYDEDYIDTVTQENYIYIDEGKYIDMIQLVDVSYPNIA